MPNGNIALIKPSIDLQVQELVITAVVDVANRSRNPSVERTVDCLLVVGHKAMAG